MAGVLTLPTHLEQLAEPQIDEASIEKEYRQLVAQSVSDIAAVDTSSYLRNEQGVNETHNRRSVRKRFFGSRIGRTATSFVAAAAGLFTTLAVEAAPAYADSSNQEYSVDSNTAEGGVYARSAPDSNATQGITGYGVWPGDTVKLICGVTNGAPVGNKYHNKTWHKVIDENNPNEGQFWISDHYLDTPNAPDSLAPGEANCDQSNAPPAVKENSNPWDKPTSSEHYYVDHVVWADVAEGKSLHVYMTTRGKLFSRLDPSKVFHEVERDSNLSDSSPLEPTLHDQFVCHAIVAPDKSWNLDTWRSDPGTADTIMDQCNPTGSNTEQVPESEYVS